MVMTQKKMREKKKEGFSVKEDNPARKHMTHAQAVEDNARLKEDREEVAKLKAKQAVARKKALGEGQPGPDPKEPEQDDPVKSEEQIANENKQIKIGELEAEKSLMKGPGSKAKKEAVQKKIDEIKSN